MTTSTPAISWRRWAVRLAVAGVLAGIVYTILVFVAVTRAADDAQMAGDSARATSIIVLGAAQYDGEPSPVLEGRLLTALRLWETGGATRIVTTGANQPGDRFTEGFAGFRWLRNAGVAEDRITVVVDGGNTYESLLAAANQLRDTDGSVLIVTDAYHALRSEEIADEVGLEATVVSAGSDTSLRMRLRETVAVALGRVLSYRRLSSLT